MHCEIDSCSCLCKKTSPIISSVKLSTHILMKCGSSTATANKFSMLAADRSMLWYFGFPITFSRVIYNSWTISFCYALITLCFPCNYSSGGKFAHWSIISVIEDRYKLLLPYDLNINICMNHKVLKLQGPRGQGSYIYIYIV